MTLAVPAAEQVPLHLRLGLTDLELVAIEARLDRPPNDLELAIFSVMWSEHCSYKSSRPLLRTLPTGGADVVAGPGENAGVVALGDGQAVAFKIESHNHPSAVEPYQGAATGVGGILRDIFTMGARPIAVLDALRFGDPADARTRHLLRGVVAGVGGYGNCVGVPTVGGELVFDPSYGGNPLVNVMAIGLLPAGRLTLAQAPGPGNLAILFGSTTGRDGIGGASVLASATFGDDDPSKRPTVQVGDPFAEKLLIEASLELIEAGLVEGLQDLGAGGISCATSETADRAGTGILIDLDAIPTREPGMAPFEVMISESQERMLAIVRPEQEAAVRAVCARWNLPAATIGRVTADGDIAIVTGGLDPAGRPNPAARELARIPAAALTSNAIVHDRLATPPAHRRAAPAPGVPLEPNDLLPERGMDPGAVLLGLIGSPNLASRRFVFEQYDSHRPGQHRGRAGPRCGRPAPQGLEEGPGGHDRRQSGRGCARPLAGRGDERGRGDPERVDHRRPAAGRDELPELRRPDPAGGVLAAPGRRSVAWPTPAGRWTCRSPAATSRSTTNCRPARSPRRRRSGSLACSMTSTGWSARSSWPMTMRSCSSASPRRALPGAPTRPSPGSRRRMARPAWTWPARPPSSGSCGPPSSAGSFARPRTCPPADWPWPWPKARSGAGAGRGCAS